MYANREYDRNVMGKLKKERAVIIRQIAQGDLPRSAYIKFNNSLPKDLRRGSLRIPSDSIKRSKDQRRKNARTNQQGVNVNKKDRAYGERFNY